MQYQRFDNNFLRRSRCLILWNAVRLRQAFQNGQMSVDVRCEMQVQPACSISKLKFNLMHASRISYSGIFILARRDSWKSRLGSNIERTDWRQIVYFGPVDWNIVFSHVCCRNCGQEIKVGTLWGKVREDRPKFNQALKNDPIFQYSKFISFWLQIIQVCTLILRRRDI